MGGFSAARQRLREWLYDGADRSTPSPNQTDVRARFAPLMRWVLSLWKSNDLAPTIDPTTLWDRLSAAVASVVYRGLRSPKFWEKIRFYGWRPYMRQSINTTFRIENGMRMPARKPVSAPNGCFIGRGTAFRAASRRIDGTIIVIRVEGQAQPWIALTTSSRRRRGRLGARSASG